MFIHSVLQSLMFMLIRFGMVTRASLFGPVWYSTRVFSTCLSRLGIRYPRYSFSCSGNIPLIQKSFSRMNGKLIIEPPVIEDRHVVKPLLCGPGPCDIWPSVAEAYQMPVLSHFCDETYNVMDDIRAGIQYIFQTRSKLVLAMSGAGHAGMEAVITNLLGPNDTLLVAVRGIWEERAKMIAERQGIKTVVTRVPMETTFSFEQLDEALKKSRPQALFITHGDGSTGTVQKLQGLGELCHKYGAFLLVDTVVSIVGDPFFMDEWGVDGVYASTQKALSGPAGISPVAFSERAQEKMKSRKHEPAFYLDVKVLAQNWNCFGNTRVYHHTMSPPLLWALRACLKEVSKETLPESWARHAANMAYFNKRLEDHKFQLLVPKPEDRMATATTVVLPEGYDHNEFCKYIREKHNIMILRGLGPTVGKALRIGIMGINSTVKVADAVIDAMVDAREALRNTPIKDIPTKKDIPT